MGKNRTGLSTRTRQLVGIYTIVDGSRPITLNVLKRALHQAHKLRITFENQGYRYLDLYGDALVERDAARVDLEQTKAQVSRLERANRTLAQQNAALRGEISRLLNRKKG